jgi:hypothetical protein
LFPLVAYPIVRLLSSLGLAELIAVRVFLAGSTVLWLASFLVLLRRVGLRPLDAAAFTLVLATSASAVFMAPIAELFVLSSTSILVALILIAGAPVTGMARFVVIQAMTFSMTVTNAFTGFIATWLCRGWKWAIRTACAAVFLVAVLWGVEKGVFPSAYFFLPDPTGRYFEPGLDFVEDRLWLSGEDSGGRLQHARAFLFHAVVMPQISLGPHREKPELPWPSTSVEDSAVGSGGAASIVATALWVILLAWGGRVAASHARGASGRVVVTVLLSLLAQGALHLFWGTEAFLYALHWVPLLTFVAAMSCLSRARRYAVGGALALAVLLAILHVRQFLHLAALVVPDRAIWSAVPGLR